jgi:hypothetical protein
MPILLQFPPIHPDPELSLKNILRTYGITDFGSFGYWEAYLKVGYKGKWIRQILSAKIDTGASISLLPASLKRDLDLDLDNGISYTLYGVVRTQECKIDVELHQLDIELHDQNNQTLLFKDVWVALSKREQSPLLLGYKDLLEHCIISQLNNSETLTLSKREE